MDLEEEIGGWEKFEEAYTKASLTETTKTLPALLILGWAT